MISEVLANYTMFMYMVVMFQLDGLLFFHKRTHYLFGTTPLVLWLKAYMLPDILNINVPLALMKTKPPQYTSFSDHVEKVKQDKIKEEMKTERKSKKKGRRSSGNEMDTSNSGDVQSPNKSADDWVDKGPQTSTAQTVPYFSSPTDNVQGSATFQLAAPQKNPFSIGISS